MDPRLAAIDWPVRTERLVLRPVTVADAPATFKIRSRDDVARWITGRATDLEAFTATYTSGEMTATGLAIELDGTVIGDLMLAIQDGWAQAEVKERARNAEAELGWTLDPDHQGHGYATEAVAAALRLCFAELGLHRVTALCFADNTASWRLMERLGMRREGHHVADSLHRSGRWMDGYAYAMLADEWCAAALDRR